MTVYNDEMMTVCNCAYVSAGRAAAFRRGSRLGSGVFKRRRWPTVDSA